MVGVHSRDTGTPWWSGCVKCEDDADWIKSCNVMKAAGSRHLGTTWWVGVKHAVNSFGLF